MSTDSGVMNSGATGSKVQCEPGCSIKEHRHGANSPGNGGGGSSDVSLGSIKAQLNQNADDQQDGQAHFGKLGDWYDQLKADILRLMGGSGQPEVGQALALLSAQADQVQEVRGQLQRSTEIVRDLAARL